MQSYIASMGGRLLNPDSTTECEFCPISDTNSFLSVLKAEYGDRWRNFGILWGYVLFNAVMAVVIYWGARVPRRDKKAGKVKEG